MKKMITLLASITLLLGSSTLVGQVGGSGASSSGVGGSAAGSRGVSGTGTGSITPSQTSTSTFEQRELTRDRMNTTVKDSTLKEDPLCNKATSDVSVRTNAPNVSDRTQDASASATRDIDTAKVRSTADSVDC